jgi:transposase
MAFTLVPDRLWREIEPLLPPEPPKPQGGRPRVPDRACLTGIVYVLRTGMPWRLVPAELGCGSGVTCWRRLREWTEAGLWPRIHHKLLAVLGRRGKLDASLAVLDSASVRAVLGGRTPAPTPRTERKTAANATS